LGGTPSHHASCVIAHARLFARLPLRTPRSAVLPQSHTYRRLRTPTSRTRSPVIGCQRATARREGMYPQDGDASSHIRIRHLQQSTRE
jgi:hypothetical protein